ncbi:nucleotidyl transferase AbiEii/AbiGii toxin family protein [Xanthobacter sp. KR7-225]|uniref:nucleotidyl transferase AbiEii/AbiGii toxin family protein n=1 Tax=Xanthobacter sp. KR7-225 TaxID=3156613 RepID=UPI0032B365AE
MAKRQLATEMFNLRQALHVVIFNALMESRRWEPGDFVFRGGTSLHLVHGSPRLSEDLDFLVGSALKLGPIADSVRAGLDGLPWLPDGAQLQVGKAKDGRNPHAFIVSIGGPDLIGSVKVKVEMWQTAEAALAPFGDLNDRVALEVGEVRFARRSLLRKEGVQESRGGSSRQLRPCDPAISRPPWGSVRNPAEVRAHAPLGGLA